jgi:DNA-binding NarL/FixJ family response regulator
VGEWTGSHPSRHLLGECRGIAIAQQLRQQGYAAEVVFLTVHEDSDFVSAATCGGRRYVIKSRMEVDLGPALKAVISHRIFISPPLRDQ